MLRHGEVAARIERHHPRAHLGAVAALHDGLVLAGDDVGVGDDEAVADHEAAALLDPAAGDAVHLHGGRDHRVDDRLRDVGRRGRRAEVRAPARTVRRTRVRTGPPPPGGGACRTCRAGRGAARRRGWRPSSCGPGRRTSPARRPSAAAATRWRRSRRPRPAAAPAPRSADRTVAPGSVACRRLPTSRPTACPMNAMPSRIPMVTNRSCGGAGVLEASQHGRQDRATRSPRPRAIPTQEATRVRNPRR